MLNLRNARLRAVGAAALLAATAVGGAGCGGALPPDDEVPNSCPFDLSQWGRLRGAQPIRGVDYYQQADNGLIDPSFYLPQQVVSGGERWSFAFDTMVEAGWGTAEVRMAVDWYSTPSGDNSGYLGHTGGTWVDVPVGSTGATHVSHWFSVPSAAVRANVLADLRAESPGNTWTGRNCDYRRGDPSATTTTTLPSSTTSTTRPPEPSTTTTTPPSSTTSTTAPPPGDQDTAAGRHGWGAPLAPWSDEFNYGSESNPVVPDQAKWDLAGGGVNQCWPGHAGNGRRCDKNSRVVGGVLRQVGEANGDSGWLGSRLSQQYGRWEARVRSMATSPDNGRQYHPLLLLWPTSNRHPEEGEYDYLENMAPGEQCAESYIHYPQNPSAPVQQEFAQRCGVDLTQWHNMAIEWTANHVKGFIDGEEWFSYSGGANAVRECIQCASAMQQAIQLDNFFGSSMQSAVYEVDWARIYSIP